MKRIFEMGGVLAGVVLVAFGIGAIAIALAGRGEVRDNIQREAIVGSSDMTPTAIKQEAAAAGLQNVDLPTCDVAGEPISTGAEAKCFAEYMRVHTLEATGGYTYSQMGRYQALPTAPKSELAEGGGTNNSQYAVKDETTGAPAANGARDLWVTSTALTTALNTSFFAERVAMFSLVMGIALLLTGVGFLVLTYLGVLKFGRRAKVEAKSGIAAPAA